MERNQKRKPGGMGTNREAALLLLCGVLCGNPGVLLLTAGIAAAWLSAKSLTEPRGVRKKAERPKTIRRLWRLFHAEPGRLRKRIRRESQRRLQLNINYSVTAKLKSVYPSAEWQWVAPPSMRRMKAGKTWRIQTFHTGAFQNAEVTLRTRGLPPEITLLQIVPLDAWRKPQSERSDAAQERGKPSDDPQETGWYSGPNEKRLGEIVEELSSRGIRSLIICENGEVRIPHAAGSGTEKSLNDLPRQTDRKQICLALEKDQIMSAVSPEGLKLIW